MTLSFCLKNYMAALGCGHKVATKKGAQKRPFLVIFG